MCTFKLEHSKSEMITPQGGLALVGHSVNRMTSLAKTSRTTVKRHGSAYIDLIYTFTGLICLGKSNIDTPCSLIQNGHRDQTIIFIGSCSSPGL
jgi:hypothetical protein